MRNGLSYFLQLPSVSRIPLVRHTSRAVRAPTKSRPRGYGISSLAACQVRSVTSSARRRQYYETQSRTPPQASEDPVGHSREQGYGVKEEGGDNQGDSTEAASERLGGSWLLPPLGRRNSPDAWATLLEQLVPEHLRFVASIGVSNIQDDQQRNRCIMTILRRARSNADVDLLSYIGTERGRWKAVLWIIDSLLKETVTEAVPTSVPERHPSNIAWPTKLTLDETCRQRKEVDGLTYTEQRLSSDQLNTLSDKGNPWIASNTKDQILGEILSNIGSIISESADMPEADAHEAMIVVYRIFGQLHNLGLIPEHVYSYSTSNFPTAAQRPPIIYLLSSRILTTMSDAVWRAHSDQMMERAVNQGAQYKDLGRDPPGGRFRQKVRSLGPEVWVEFALWCCVDGGFASAGSRIIRQLQKKTKKPWFAVSWIRNGKSAIEWDRVKLRHGGVVGQIEGYSSERPFVEMEPRTITSEVVLSLVESVVDSVYPDVSGGTSVFLREAKQIKSLISFLEPHELPRAYFDYLAVRTGMASGFHPDVQPQHLQEWNSTIDYLRSLESVDKPMEDPAPTGFEAILQQSEVVAGLLQQGLDIYVRNSDARNAVEVFALVQQQVDDRKMQSIGAFLGPTGATESSLSPHDLQHAHPSTPNNVLLGDVQSFGQLPAFRVAGFLNLITDSKLARLGHWMIYNEDVDGPTISATAFGQSCFSDGLIRFGAMTGDRDLVELVESTRRRSTLKPSVSTLRALVDAYVVLGDLTTAVRLLQELSKSAAGGFSPGNLATLGASIIKVESKASEPLNQKKDLLVQLLGGAYRGRSGTWTLQQRDAFDRQVASILRVFSSIPNTSLNRVADDCAHRWPISNHVNLPAAVFNTILSAVIDVRGAQAGRRIWDMFCEDPREDMVANIGSAWQHSAQRKDDVTTDEDEFIPFEQVQVPVANHYPAQNKGNDVSSMAVESGSPSPGDAAVLPESDTQVTEVSADSGVAQAAHFMGVSGKVTRRITPVVRPDLRTLRLIVRAALTEQTHLRNLQRDVSEQHSVLKWAQQFYKAFGCTRQSIEHETQQEYVQHEKEHQLHDTARMLYDDERQRSSVSERVEPNVANLFRRVETHQVRRMTLVDLGLSDRSKDNADRLQP